MHRDYSGSSVNPIEQRLPSGRIIERKLFAIDRRDPASGSKIDVGPRDAAALRPISLPNLRFSSTLVRIRVTVGLC